MDAMVVSVLIALVTVFGSAMIALLLYALNSIGKRFTTVEGRVTGNTDDIHCIDKKVQKVGILIALAHPEIVTKSSPLNIRPNEDIEQAARRFMTEDKGGEQDEGKVLGKCKGSR